ncbi:MAG: hypothetical protein QM504_12950 [Pseudomonadota bacterium]
MKNQYFGDINDYKKFGLLRSISSAYNINTLIAWMLTPNDGSTDGKFTEYLNEPTKWNNYDPILYQELVSLLNDNDTRRVSLIENSNVLSNTQYYSNYVTDSANDRDAWLASLLEQSNKSDLVFLDPDNGLEISSIGYGRSKSSKYLFWKEVSALWAAGKSVLIYQHFIREKREVFIRRMLDALSQKTEGSLVEAFSTSNVVFLMALQPHHQAFHKPLIQAVQASWKDQIKVFSCVGQGRF